MKINQFIKYLANLKNDSGSYSIAIKKLNLIKNKLEEENSCYDFNNLKTEKKCCYMSACNSLNKVKQKIELILK